MKFDIGGIDFADLLVILRDRTVYRRHSGLRDASDFPISEGDIILFYAMLDKDGKVKTFRHKQRSPFCFTMVDVVQEVDDVFYAVNYDQEGGVLLATVAADCEVIGSVHSTGTQVLKANLKRFA